MAEPSAEYAHLSDDTLRGVAAWLQRTAESEHPERERYAGELERVVAELDRRERERAEAGAAPQA